ncbi:hypothetical protein IG626_09515 [Desulfovibrio desulfuricans]|uniref:hypothetical protein n=1 Tax=Desulfovibrio desulfuricans TaxID=876 RepID=UPI001781855E|nr:hypothetical protein [Desulfovibrio desulfuricans]MBD8896239.1 hypothetical protein [Desulfovibrio desulfuricans]
MKTITKQPVSVKPPRSARLVFWIVNIDGQRARVPATFNRFLGLVPSILPGSGKEKAVR